jgi:hypothetical protein
MNPLVRFRALSCLCAALLGAATVPAWADARAAVRLANLGYSVVDLAPDDGVAAGATFITQRMAAEHWASVLQQVRDASGQPPPDGGWRSVDDFGYLLDRIFVSDDRLATLGDARASTTLQGDVGAHRFGATLSAHAGSDRSDGLYYNSATASAWPMEPFYESGDEPFTVTLAAHTALVWSGDVRLEVEKGPRGPALRHDYAFADVFLGVRDPTDRLLTGWGATLTTRDRPPGALAQDFNLHLAWANPGDNAVQGVLWLGMVAHTANSVGPVPEPGTLALMLCGLAAVGTAARRKRL